MYKFRFELRSPKVKTETPIHFICALKGNRLTYPIGLKVIPSHWDKSKQRVGNYAAAKNKVQINKKINSIDNAVCQFMEKCSIENLPLNKATLKQFLENHLNPIEEKEILFFDFITRLIDTESTRINPITGRSITKGTIKSLRGTAEQLRLFEIANYKLSFDSITLDWYYDFIAWCNLKNYSPNNIGKHIKNTKKFMSEAIEQGLTENATFRSKRFIVIKEDVDNIYLTLQELKRMYELDLTSKPTHEKARDLFLLGAYTGLRVSDFNDIKAGNIIKRIDGYRLKIETQKTDHKVIIPLHPIALAILEKYKGQTTKRIADQTINEKIKEVGKLADITELETINRTKGGLKISKRVPRYELIKTHTARRSFCTNAYLSGIAPIDIMAISTHKTESAFMKYIKITKEQQADRLAESPFFKAM